MLFLKMVFKKLLYFVFSLLFPKLKKFNISAIYNPIILIFAEYLPIVFIYKF